MALIYDPSIDDMVDDGTGTGTGDTGTGDTGTGDTVVDDPGFDWEKWIKENPDSGLDAANSPTEQEVKDAIQFGTSTNPLLARMFDAFGTKAKDFLKSSFYDPATGKVNMAGLATAAAGIYGLLNKDKPGGYNVPVPKMDMVRQQVQHDDTNRRPGEGGRRYFTDPQYVAKTPEARDAANVIAAEQAKGLASLPAAAPKANPWAGKYVAPWEKAAPAAPAQAPTAAVEPSAPPAPVFRPEDQKYMAQPTGMAQGGVAGLAKGGRYLAGKTDGMADKIPTTIDGKDRAALSHGEFVIPADVVSHLGNGNSEAGAQKLYSMMDRIRQARTGTKKQGRQINADKIIAASTGGGIKGYAEGGAIQNFDAGGVIPPATSVTSTLSPWVGDYVTGALGEANAAASAPYQAYGGPLTAGESDLQQQSFAGLSGLASAGYTPGTFSTETFDAGQAQKYMNPYLQSVLDPQMKEMQRQADIQRVQDAGRLTKAGAFGGSRQAIMESEGNRNLLGKQTEALGTGYKNAFDTAMGQFNTEQGRNMDVQNANEKSRQYSSDFGLKSLESLGAAGATQRGIESEGIAADKKAFEDERDYALKMPQYKLDLLSKLPIGAEQSSTNADSFAQLSAKMNDLLGLYNSLSKLGVAAPAPAAPAP